jgi:hypothetical protein
MADQISKFANRARAKDDAVWVQKDAVRLRNSVDSCKPNPFVQNQAASFQIPIHPTTPAGSQPKNP